MLRGKGAVRAPEDAARDQQGVLRLLDGSRGKRHRVGEVGLWRVQWRPVPEVPVAVGECVPCGQKGGGVGGELRIAGTGAVRQSRH